MRGLLLAILAMCVSCTKQPTQTIIYRLDANHYLGDAVEQGNLTVWPVFRDKPNEIGEFLTLAEAQKRGVATVREQNVAEVATLTIENKGTLPILVCAGSLVKGGQQDRQIGQDFVISAKTTVPVDAFCVEQSRWHGGTGFNALNVMATSEVRKAAQYDRNQGKVWEQVAKDRDGAIRVTIPDAVDADAVFADDQEVPFALVGIPVTSRNVFAPNTRGAVYASDISHCDVATAKIKPKQDIRKAIAAFFAKLKRAPVGFAYAIGGQPVSVRTFAHTRLMEDQFHAFLDAMCLESLLSSAKTAGGKTADIVKLVRAITQQKEEVVATTAANTNGYRKGEAGFNGSCYVRRNGLLIAITRDWSSRK